MFRGSLAALFSVLLLLAVFASSADAETYCVAKTDASCTGPAYTASQLQQALDAANNNGTPDTILIGPVDLTTSAEGFRFQNTEPDGTLQIIGSGRGATRITSWDVDTAPDENATTTGLYVDAGPGSQVSGLGVVMPQNTDGTTDIGITLGEFTDAESVSVTSDVAYKVRGISTFGGDIFDTSIDLPLNNDGSIGIDEVSRSVLVEDSDVRATDAIRHSSPAYTTTINRTFVSGVTGARTDGGNFVIKDSVFRILPGNNPTGVCLCNGNAGDSEYSATIDGTTFVGDGSPGTFGVMALADNGTEGAVIDLRNSVIANTQNSLVLIAGNGRTVEASTDYSMYDTNPADVSNLNGVFIKDDIGGADGTVMYAPGPGVIDLVADPGFTNATAGDLSLTSSSPLVDVGDPAAPGVGEIDIVGNVRACNGTPGGAKRRDIGAYEYNDCIDPDTSFTSGPNATTEDTTPAFAIQSTKPSSTFKCAFDGGAPATCAATFDAPDLGLGSHTVTVTATDTYGNSDPTPATRNYTVIETVVPPTCVTDSSLCPVVDKTKPVVKLTGKLKKSTSARSVKVKFRSNEAGSTFTCQVGKAKVKKCRSPYTLKLKEGNNTLKVIATDKAGNRSRPLTVKVKRK